jgi:tRNA threonylcarbamoyl adenosine modification protein YjeE
MLGPQVSKSIEDTEALAIKIIPQILAAKIATFSGGLGSGKTLMCQSIIRFFSGNKNLSVTSPTFNIVKTYDTPHGVVHHYDLYRLKHSSEIEEIGLADILNHKSGICLIEWPEIIQSFIPKNALNISIEIDDRGNRHIFGLTQFL